MSMEIHDNFGHTWLPITKHQMNVHICQVQFSFSQLIY